MYTAYFIPSGVDPSGMQVSSFGTSGDASGPFGGQFTEPICPSLDLNPPMIDLDDVWWDHYNNGNGKPFDMNQYPIIHNQLSNHSLTQGLIDNAFSMALSNISVSCNSRGSSEFNLGTHFVDYAAPITGSPIETLCGLPYEIFGSGHENTTLFALGGTNVQIAGSCNYSRSCTDITENCDCRTGVCGFRRRECKSVTCSFTLFFSDGFIDAMDPPDLIDGDQDFYHGTPYKISGSVVGNRSLQSCGTSSYPTHPYPSLPDRFY